MPERKRTTIARPMTPEELKAFRKKHGLSQRDLAELLGVRQSTIGNWEAGIRKIPVYLYKLLICLEKEGLI